jgi:hypothetical protein
LIPLRRNRDFVLLQLGQLLSNAGTSSTGIAYPLLVLAVTHSPAKAGIVGFARQLPAALFMIPAGVAADRLNRRWLMIVSDVVRIVAMASLAALVIADTVVFWVIPVVAFIEGAGAALFGVSQVGALRAVVPPRQLPAAISAQSGRRAVVQLGGPPFGGALFDIGRAVPFLFDAVSYVGSTVSLIAMRTPFQETREPDHAGFRARITEGIRFLWTHPFLRTCAFLFGLGNFLGPGLFLALIIIGKQQGLSAFQVGALSASLGACALVGSFLTPVARRYLPARSILLLELWTGLTLIAFLFWPNVYVLAASMLPTALVIPSTDSMVHAFGIALTPERLVSRVEAVRSTISLSITPLGPLVAGVMLGATSPRATVAVFFAVAFVLASWGTMSPSIRAAPGLDDLESAAGS